MQKQNDPHTDIINFLNNIGNVAADKVNTHFKSKYASLAEVLECIKSEAKKHNLTVHQSLNSADGMLHVKTEIIHNSGANRDCGTLSIRTEGMNAQQLGSAVTYLRRQTLQTACGIAVDVDDDGEKASAQAASRADDKKFRLPNHYAEIIKDEASRPGALKYLVKKGWLKEGEPLEELSHSYIDTINAYPEAFKRAIKTANEQK
jgi:hypothetical protein